MRPNSPPDMSTHRASSAVLAKTTTWVANSVMRSAATR
jgi:hypothetical protein